MASRIPAVAQEILGTNKVGTTQTHETILPAVTHEQIQKTVIEEQQIIQDREHHVHHHQQRVQPIVDRVVEPEIHQQNVLPVEQREKNYEMTEGAARALREQQTKYRDEQTILPTQKSTIQREAIGQDVTHHHVHETIVPLIQREKIQQEVVHTVIPVHEIIHERPVVHEATVEPTLTMDQFLKKGGNLHGAETVARDVRVGEPATLTGHHASGQHEHTTALGTHGHGESKLKTHAEEAAARRI